MCDKPLILDTNNGIKHLVCFKEYKRRIENNVCAQCGENPLGPSSDRCCMHCNICSEFKHYNGPS